jgi:Icc protein
MLDSCAPGHVGGRLAPSELARLDETLGRAPAHAMVCLHHHPIAMGSRWLDDIGLANADEFWRVIDRHSSVRAVVWGHVHQAHDGRRGDLRLIATPSTGAQFLPHSDGYAIDRRPPAFRHFRLHADGRIDTRLHWVDAAASHELASG